ncbi:CDP-glycerol glycerophosphotransferase family protein [Modestobacter altitudinis]|uniref:CDP-glycerol glycerophosphotransferase family protein n=1 Tax=Modestobacter altitudinis TaxID=2213158 RepID=UPI00110C9C22|nr:CDP-glycerol glycerophosphotransferase family protein [Modestobacter altitudinis]
MPPSLFSPAGLRSAGGRVIRRLGLLPGGEPDGLGEDAAIGDLVLPQRVLVFFPEPVRNAYQLEQWLPALAELDRQQGVALVTQDSRTTARLRERTSLPVHCVARTATLDRLVTRGRSALALYVSHHPRNFQLLRFPTLAHAYLGHGESDKAVSASNQLKAYDRSFVAGQAAVDRISAELLWFDADRLVRIGRPQVTAAAARKPGQPPTVLYAPTWEGAQPSMAYSSVASHGAALLASLAAAGLRVVYRPHPRTGANRREVAEADQTLRRLVSTPPLQATGSTVDVDSPLETAFARADALVTDVSSLAPEWLPTGRPLVVTVPAAVGAVVPPSPLLAAAPRLAAADAGGAGELLRRLLTDDDLAPRRSELVNHYLGDIRPGAATEAFLAACAELVAAVDGARTTARP